jgi:hypothetical protein
MLQVDKRGRFITDMGFANVVTAAVDFGRPRIKGSCMVILEETDPGTGIAARPPRNWCTSSVPRAIRSSTCGAGQPHHRRLHDQGRRHRSELLPQRNHRGGVPRTRVTVGLMTSAKLLSAVEPVILYQRRRFRGGEGAPGTPRYELGLQQKEDVLHRLGGHLGDGRSQRLAGLCRRPRVRRTGSPREAKGRIPRGQETHGPRSFQGWPRFTRRARTAGSQAKAREAGRDEHGLPSWRPNPLIPVRDWIRWPMCSVPPASFGTPAMART